MANLQVFLDANVIIYSLDKTSESHSKVVDTIQQLLDDGVTLCTSHHVIEEVLYIARKIGGNHSVKVVKQIYQIPDLVLVEPDATIEFAKRYAFLAEDLNMGINDALLLQLIIDSEIAMLFSYDNQFVDQAKKLNIEQVI